MSTDAVLDPASRGVRCGRRGRGPYVSAYSRSGPRLRPPFFRLPSIATALHRPMQIASSWDNRMARQQLMTYVAFCQSYCMNNRSNRGGAAVDECRRHAWVPFLLSALLLLVVAGCHSKYGTSSPSGSPPLPEKVPAPPNLQFTSTAEGWPPRPRG